MQHAKKRMLQCKMEECCAICAGFASLLFLGVFARFQTEHLTTAIPVWNVLSL